MGKQELEKDRVASLLQLEEWEDDQTATTAATTVADSDSDSEDETETEAIFEEENKYREPPIVSLYSGQGTSITNKTVLELRAREISTKKKRARDTTHAEEEAGNRFKASKKNVVRCDVAVCAVPAASTRGSTNPRDKRAELWPDTMHACQSVSNEAVCAVPAASTGGSIGPMDKCAETRPDTLHNDPAAKAKGSDKHARMRPDAVSYTHLTLPTISSV